MSSHILDTDVLSEVLAGDQRLAGRLLTVPPMDRATTIVTVDEIVRGRTAVVRRAEGGGKPDLVTAYGRLHETLDDLRRLTVLPYDRRADAQFGLLRSLVRGRAGTHDLRIAAIAMSRGGTVVTRNRHHFREIPGLQVEFWE
jgi:tRNA(fMet)-specific endonuclease VapC